MMQDSKTIHFVGIKGIAMAALAVVAHEQGIAVTGSDSAGDEHYPSDAVLAKIGVEPRLGFNPAAIEAIHPDLVVYTGAHQGKENPEVVKAVSLGIPVAPHGIALGEFMNGKKQISIAGCHGKTTTASMIATILTQAGTNPSYAVGSGMIGGLGLPGHTGFGDYFVAEADEYVTDPGHDMTPRFLWQKPHILVVTNIDYDHPDVYESLAKVKEAYGKLRDQIQPGGVLVYNLDDPDSGGLPKDGVTSIGVSSGPGDHYWFDGVQMEEGKTQFVLHKGQERIGAFELRVPGLHNVHNGAMAIVAAMQAGLTPLQIKEGLAQFTGAARRFEQKGTYNGMPVIDDYAHHPSEVAVTIHSARSWFPDSQLIVIFQPHTYSRTRALLDDFAQSLSQADVVMVADIYASAREQKATDISSQHLVRAIQKKNPNVSYEADFTAVQKKLATIIQKKSIILFMGAGNIYEWSSRLVEQGGI